MSGVASIGFVWHHLRRPRDRDTIQIIRFVLSRGGRLREGRSLVLGIGVVELVARNHLTSSTKLVLAVHATEFVAHRHREGSLLVTDFIKGVVVGYVVQTHRLSVGTCSSLQHLL